MNAYDVAKELLKNGVECIPLNLDKMPLVKFADQAITNDFIKKHQDKYAMAHGLGWLCRGYWCIDIDRHGDNGFESIYHSPHCSEIERNLLNTLVQQTAGGGVHLVFKKRDCYEYGQKIGYMKGVDIKANVNNYFVMGGSQSRKGLYRMNAKEPQYYQGALEELIFNPPEKKFSMANVLGTYDFSHLPRLQSSGQGLGKQAYERIINGQSISRNQDLFLASSYAKSCNVSIEPLRVLIGDSKNGDVFTEREWLATVESAWRG